MSVAIVDYGCGNLHSVAKAFEHVLSEMNKTTSVWVTSDPNRVLEADHVVLPGVGAFFSCREALRKTAGLEEALFEHTHRKGKPFLGICVGMQLLASRGLEHQVTEGLNWIEGDVVRIAPESSPLKVPHIGWNTIEVMHAHPVLDGIQTGRDGLNAYFVHSYAFQVKNQEHCVAKTHYGQDLTAIVAKDTIIGMQFHPEKSQKLGLLLIRNFLRWQP